MQPIKVTCDVAGMDVAEVSPSSSSASPPSSLVLRNRDKVTRKRARFNPDQRVKVNAVRKRGACLRCRLMKITCSQDDLCTTCERAARSSYALEKGSVSFIGCIRTTLAQVSVFEHVFTSMPAIIEPSWTFSAAGGNQNGSIRAASPDILMLTTLVTQSLLVGMWKAGGMKVNNENGTSNANAMAIAASLQSEVIKLLGLPIVEELRECFITMYVLAASPNTNRQLFAMSGHQCLKWLDRKLKPYCLSKCSIMDLRALLFLVYGTLHAVVNAIPATEHPLFPTDEYVAETDPKKTLFDALKEHLSRMLLYYISFITSKTGLERLTTFDDIASKVTTRSQNWEEKTTLFAVAGLEKHGTDLFKSINYHLNIESNSPFSYSPEG